MKTIGKIFVVFGAILLLVICVGGTVNLPGMFAALAISIFVTPQKMDHG